MPVPLAVQPAPPPQPAPYRDLTLFPHSYLIVFGLALAVLVVIVADNLADARITAGFIQYRAPTSKPLDQYLLATIRGGAAVLVAILTLCCGSHIAVRPTRMAPARYAIAALFIGTGFVLLGFAYICESDYMAFGLEDIARKLRNIWGMKWK